MMKKAALIIVNGLPASGKTTLARRLGVDASLPVFSRDGMYETLYDAFDCLHNGEPPLLGQTSFTMLYYVIGSLLAGGRPLIVEGFFGRPELRSAEFQQLQTAHGFEPLQIVCRANGEALLQRIVERAGSRERHIGHHDLEHLAANKERILQGDLIPLALGGQLIEIDTTTPSSFDYVALLQQVREALSHSV